MSIRSGHLSITQVTSSDEEEDSDATTQHQSDMDSMNTQPQPRQHQHDNESSGFLTPTAVNRRRSTLTQTAIPEESSEGEDDPNYINPMHHIQSKPPPKKKSISMSRRRTNSTKYTQSVTDDDTDDSSEEQHYEIYGGEPPKPNKDEKLKQKQQRNKGLLPTICILTVCISIAFIIVVALYWAENPYWYKPKESTPSDPQFEVNPNITSHPTIQPTAFPTGHPLEFISLTSTHSPSIHPSIEPTNNPSNIPSLTPTISPSYNPTVEPTIDPTIKPSTVPTTEPTKLPTIEPTTDPTYDPTMDPTFDPTTDPTVDPTTNPSEYPTNAPTQSPISIILRAGNTIIDQGITTEWPAEAFPDSVLEITISEAQAIDPFIKSLYDESTSAFKAYPIDDITNNYYLFDVENDPLPTADISYTFTIPIPTDLVSDCPSDYGYEIFTYEEQTGFGTESWPLMVLYESIYDDASNSLQAQFYPEMWINREADILLSCTPGSNTVPPTRRRRQLLQGTLTSTTTECHANPISCPIPLKLQTDHCKVLEPYSRRHIGVDYEVETNGDILAAAEGVIEKSEDSAVYGNIIVLRHLDGSATVYKNLDSRAKVIGNAVNVSDVIGTASGHLHFEYIPNGELFARKGYIDPAACVTEEDVESGSIEVSDSGSKADDAFSMHIDGFYICETELGEMNKCTVSNLKCGSHELSIEIIAAPDGYGTWLVQLFDGWTFSDGTTKRDNFRDGNLAREPEGHIETWMIEVPCTNNDAVSGFVP